MYSYVYRCIVFHQAAKKVENAIRGKGDMRLKDLAMMGIFSHTGCNEVLNNLHNKVKKYRFVYVGT
jgi:hypothetical protein